MNPPSVWTYRRERLYCDQVALARLAERYGTPLFVYSARAIRAQYAAYQDALRAYAPRLHYAVKANSNLAILRLLTDLGCGFDVVSAGELHRVLRVGASARNIVFYGVGKTQAELELAVRRGLGHLGLESVAEAGRVMQIATRLKRRVRVLLRLNPNVRVTTHSYIATGRDVDKFGLAAEEALALSERLAQHPYVHLTGLGCHIGSQVMTMQPFVRAARRLSAFSKRLAARGLALTHLSLGGGFGIGYHEGESSLHPTALKPVFAMLARLPNAAAMTFMLEPGRSLVARAGVLLTEVEYIKPGRKKAFAIVNAAMNDLVRPALYGAYHRVLPVYRRRATAASMYDLVGPVCESGDFLARARRLVLHPGDLLALADCGAYAMSMASNYNSRPRAAEVMVQGRRHFLIRRRETLADQLRLERVLPA